MGMILIDRNELKKALVILKRVKGYKSNLLKGMGYLSVRDGVARFSVTDLEVAVSRTIQVENLADSFETAIPLAELAAFVASAEGNRITIETVLTGHGPTLTISDEQSSIVVVVVPLDEMPILPNVDSEFADVNTLDTIETRSVLEFVARAASKDETRYNLNGVYFDDDHDAGGDPKWVATDGHRLHYDGTGIDGDQLDSHIIPSGAIARLLDCIGKRPAKGCKRIQWDHVGTNHAFKVGPWEVVYREIEGEYPNWRQVVPKDPRVQASFDANDCRKAAESQVKAAKAAGEKKLWVAFLVDATGGELARVNTNISRFSASGEAQRFGINPKYLAEALKGFKEKRVTLRHRGEFDDKGDLFAPVRFDSDGTRVGIVSPIRL